MNTCSFVRIVDSHDDILGGCGCRYYSHFLLTPTQNRAVGVGDRRDADDRPRTLCDVSLQIISKGNLKGGLLYFKHSLTLMQCCLCVSVNYAVLKVKTNQKRNWIFVLTNNHQRCFCQNSKIVQ